MKKHTAYIKKFVNIIAICMLFCCCHSNNASDSNTSIFSDYLNKHFNTQIPAESHYYILVPKSGCQGAMIVILQLFDATNFTVPITVITTNKPMVTQYLHKDWPVLSDETGDMDFLNLPIGNITVIATKDGKIIDIKHTQKCDDPPTELLKLLKGEG